MKIVFIDADGNEISQTETLGTYNSFWTLFSEEEQIPLETRYVRMILMGTRYAGDDNDSYFDDLFLKIWQNTECLNLLGDLNQDSIINILDVILMINVIIENDDSTVGDMNGDYIINVLDVVLLVNIILDS